MGINLYWDKDHQDIMICEIKAPWTWEQFHFESQTERSLVSRFDGEYFDLIVDMRRSRGMPSGGGILNVVTNLRLKPRIRRMTIVVTDDHFLTAMVRVFHQIYPAFKKSFLVFSRMEDAYTFIESKSNVMQRS